MKTLWKTLRYPLGGFILFVIVQACEKENPQPENNDPNPSVGICNCGEITNINQYYPNTFFTYTVRNECTGNDTIVNNATYYNYGLNMCFEKQW